MPDLPNTSPAEPPAPQDTDVYAIHGADPEVLAYAMAKYSRSALTMRESLAEISSQRAEQFLNTFYFQYGHRSIADLAHVPLAIERLSLLAAISLVDEQRWDGQERSTRYQNFRRSGWYTPAFDGPNADTQKHAFTAAAEALFHAYDRVGAGMLEALQHTIPCPAEMKQDAYLRTLKARAFDVARYLLPLATNTSLGQITNARTLETQISRLLSSDFPEIRALGEKLRNAAAGEAWNVTHDAARVLLDEAASFDIYDAPGPANASRQNFHTRLSEALLHPVKTAPTLVKYAAPNPYLVQTRAELRAAAAELMGSQPIDPAPVVDLVENPASLEHEIATSLLYPECHYSWRQLASAVAALPGVRIAEIIRLGTAHRGRHDELPRPFAAGAQSLRFDILMDIGGFRDMHRHRRCLQLIQPYTHLHGFEDPTAPGQPTLAEAGLADLYTQAMTAAHQAFQTLAPQAQQNCHSERSEGPPSPGITARHLDRSAKREADRPPHDASGQTPGGPSIVEPHGAMNGIVQSSQPPALNPEAAYLLPLGTRIRSMFKMDFAESLYIAELRSGVAGHFSYRRIAWEMYLAVSRRHPALAPLFRIEDVHTPVDLLKR